MKSLNDYINENITDMTINESTKTKINVRNFKHVKTIKMFGKRFESVYCHNYYYDKVNDVLILSESDDDMGHTYYIIEKNGMRHIGCSFGIYNIFDDEKDYDGEPPIKNGIVELDASIIY